MNPISLIRAVTGWSQARLAHAAATSQPAIAAYESGSKSPTWRTIGRVARAADIACYPWAGPRLTREQERSLALHHLIAAELMGDPAAVVSRAKDNLATMRRVNPGSALHLDEWERILRRPASLIVSIMLDPSEHGRELRQVTPFAGVLDHRQRAEVYSQFRRAA